MTAYLTFHASCVNPHSIQSGPGDLIIATREPMALLDQDADHLGLLEAGAPLFVVAGAPCLPTAVLRHCFGIGEPSAFRAAIAELLVPPADTLAPSPLDARRIDDWLSQYALVRVRSHTTGPVVRECRVGWFNQTNRCRDTVARGGRRDGI